LFSLLVFYAVGGKHCKNNYIITFLKLFVLASFVFVLLSSFQGFSFYRFAGFFDNPNGMGRFAAWTALFCLLYFYIFPTQWKSPFINVLNIFTFLTSFVFLLASNSRLSAGTLIVGISSVFTLTILRKLLLMRCEKYFFRNIITCLLVFVSFCSLLYEIGLFDSLIFKIISTSESGDFSNSRFVRWEEAVPYITWFGQGHNIYELADLKEVHSNYIGQALVYGVLPCIFVYLLLFTMFFKSVLGFIFTGISGYLVSVSFFSFYFFYSIFETGFVVLPLYIAVFFLGFADKFRMQQRSAIV
jgi:hypothetical protein